MPSSPLPRASLFLASLFILVAPRRAATETQLNKAMPGDFSQMYPFTSGTPPVATDEGFCGTAFDAPAFKLIHAQRRTPEEMGRMSLERHGFTAVLDAWTRFPQSNPLRTQHPLHHSGSPELMKVRCRRDIWSEVKPRLLEVAPKCWRQRGFVGRCERHGDDEQACRNALGCEWNPPTDALLIDEFAPLVAVEHTVSLASRRRFEWCRSIPEIYNGFEDEAVGKVFPERPPGTRLTAHELRTTMSIFDNLVDGEIEENAAIYRRNGVPLAQKALVDEILTQHRVDEATSLALEQREERERDGQAWVASCMKNHGRVASFPRMHVDLVVRGMRALYHVAMDGMGEARAAVRRTDALELGRRAPVLGYTLEMANFWTPMEHRPIMVNPLAIRLDAAAEADSESEPSASPMDPGGRHGCPTRAQEDPVRVVYAPLREGQGWLFWTRWTMHTALQVYDLDIEDPDENCRTSAEFRFFYLGPNPPTYFVPDIATLEGKHGAVDVDGKHFARVKELYKAMRAMLPPSSFDQDYVHAKALIIKMARKHIRGRRLRKAGVFLHRHRAGAREEEPVLAPLAKAVLQKILRHEAEDEAVAEEEEGDNVDDGAASESKKTKNEGEDGDEEEEDVYVPDSQEEEEWNDDDDDDEGQKSKAKENYGAHGGGNVYIGMDDSPVAEKDKEEEPNENNALLEEDEAESHGAAISTSRAAPVTTSRTEDDLGSGEQQEPGHGNGGRHLRSAAARRKGLGTAPRSDEEGVLEPGAIREHGKGKGLVVGGGEEEDEAVVAAEGGSKDDDEFRRRILKFAKETKAEETAVASHEEPFDFVEETCRLLPPAADAGSTKG